MAVLLFHAKESYFPLGYLGVDVFFVISGFVVTPLILRIFTEREVGAGLLSNLVYFYQRRFYRLVPAMAATLVISAILVLFLAPPGEHQRFTRQGIATILLIGNLGANRYAGDYFFPNPNPLLHTWSLSVEEQIYIFLPLILIISLHGRKNPKKSTSIVLGFIAVISLISFLFPTILEPIYVSAGIEIASQVSFYSPIDRIWQFALGGLAFIVLNRRAVRLKRFARTCNLIFVLALVLILFGQIHIDLKASSILASLIAVSLITLRSLDEIPTFIGTTFEWLGYRSYSIYLVHMPLLFLAKHTPVTQIGNGNNRIIQSIVAVAFSILLGALSYSTIENRFRDRGKSKIPSVRVISNAMVITFLAPLTLFFIMDVGSQNNYWGLEKNISQPKYAGDLDSKCDRDSPVGPPCTYPITGATKTVLLIGDSHAGHVSQALVDAAKNEGWNAVVKAHSGCPILFSQSKSNEIRYPRSCIKSNRQMYRWVLRNKPTAVIVSEFVRLDSPQENLREALVKIHRLVPNLLLIENNPVFPDAQDFMVQRPLVLKPYKAPKAFMLSKMQLDDKSASDQLAKWARGQGIATTNIGALFCDSLRCNRYSKAGWLYRDDDHLSVAGAELTIPGLRAFLRRF